MPNYNQELFLDEAIESILTQTFQDFELIIVDDGSADNSWQIISKYSERDKRIKSIRHTTNLETSQSRNEGLIHACGKYVAMMDSDDISFSNRLQDQVNYLETYQEIDILGAQIVVIDSSGNEIGHSTYPLLNGIIKWRFLFGSQLANPVVMMRSEVFNQCKYENAIAAEDFKLWVKLSEGFRFFNLPQYLLKYRQHEGSLSKQQFHIQRKETYQIIEKYIYMLINERISEDLIIGLLDSRKLASYSQAKELCQIIIKLIKTAQKWDVSRDEHIAIRINAAEKLRSIFYAVDSDTRLLTFVIYSLYLYPKAIIHRLLNKGEK